MKDSRIYHQLSGFLNTPSLFIGQFNIGFNSFHLPKYTIQEREEMIAALDLPAKLVMGKRMEHFFKVAIKYNSMFKLLANNIQIHQNKITLGEIDFLVEELPKKKKLHIELMYKIYVYDPEIPMEMERWIGPNRKDSLVEKLQKVKTNQFPLLHTSQARSYLNSIDIFAKDLEQQICFKAKLFIPKLLKDHNFSQVNNKCISGYWYKFDDFIQHFDTNFKFLAPEKQDWSISPEHCEKLVSFSEIIEDIKEMHLQNKSPLVWIQNQNGEFESAIVVWW